MVESLELNFRTLFLTIILTQMVVASNLSYFGILFEKPILININKIFTIISILIDIGIYIGRRFYNYISDFIKALENYDFFNIEEDDDIEEINKYKLDVDSKNNYSDENPEDEDLNQNNEKLNEYLSKEYNKAINDLTDLIQREISKKDD